MQRLEETQRTLSLALPPRARVAVYPDLRKWVDGFLIAKRAKSTARRTVEFYGVRLAEFAAYCEKRNVSTIDAMDAGLIREFQLHRTLLLTAAVPRSSACPTQPARTCRRSIPAPILKHALWFRAHVNQWANYMAWVA